MERIHKEVETCEKSCEDKGKEGSREGIQKMVNFHSEYEIGWINSLTKPELVGKECIQDHQKSDKDC